MQRIELAQKHDARDTTQRKRSIAELEATIPRRSQYVPGGEIPERSWAVRLAKWLAFNDFGAYTKHFKAENWVDPEKQAIKGPHLPVVESQHAIASGQVENSVPETTE